MQITGTYDIFGLVLGLVILAALLILGVISGILTIIGLMMEHSSQKKVDRQFKSINKMESDKHDKSKN